MAAFPDPALEVANDEELTIIEACLRGDCEKVKRCLDEGCSIEHQDQGLTPLLAAILGGKGIAILELLVERGVNLNYSTAVYPPPLHFCVMNKRQDAFDYLCNHVGRTSGWASIPPYLRDHKDLFEFMKFTGFNSKIIKELAFMGGIVHEFMFPAAFGEHPHIVTTFAHKSMVFVVRMADLARCPICRNKRVSRGSSDSGVFVGLSQTPGINETNFGRIKFSFRIDITRPNDFSTWQEGVPFENAVISTITDDWGAWGFERYNRWHQDCITDGNARRARIHFVLRQ